MSDEERQEFKNLFNKYCNSKREKGHCDDYGCENCLINSAYEEIFYDDEAEEDNI